jgi:hypothetical protein
LQLPAIWRPDRVRHAQASDFLAAYTVRVRRAQTCFPQLVTQAFNFKRNAVNRTTADDTSSLIYSPPFRQGRSFELRRRMAYSMKTTSMKNNALRPVAGLSNDLPP